MLHSEIRVSPERGCTIIVACFVLHNIAVKFREPESDDINVSVEDFNVQEQYRGRENGNAMRWHITDTFF